MEWEPRPATVAWANQIAGLPQYADHTAVLLTHDYLQADNTRSTTTNVAADYVGQELWDGLIKTNPNFEMVFNGHFGGDGEGYLESTGNAGNTVHQMFFNTQFETLGGDGWIRLVEFLNDGKTVRVRTYSPLLDLYRTTAGIQFRISSSRRCRSCRATTTATALSMRPTMSCGGNRSVVRIPAADGNDDGIVNQLDYSFGGSDLAIRCAGAGTGDLLRDPGAVDRSIIRGRRRRFLGRISERASSPLAA